MISFISKIILILFISSISCYSFSISLLEQDVTPPSKLKVRSQFPRYRIHYDPKEALKEVQYEVENGIESPSAEDESSSPQE